MKSRDSRGLEPEPGTGPAGTRGKRSPDPRLNVVALSAFAGLVATSQRLSVVALGLGLAVLAAALNRVPPGRTLLRLGHMDLLLLPLFVTLPLASPGGLLGRVGPPAASQAGTLLALAIFLKANAVALGAVALLTPLSMVDLGRALRGLKVPAKLVHLFVFSVRYLELMRGEAQRLSTAMRARCFRPRTDLHTLRTGGYAVAVLLVRSLERGDRVLAAMKCRGFGQGSTAPGPSPSQGLSPRDWVLGGVLAVVWLGLGWLEWMG